MIIKLGNGKLEIKRKPVPEPLHKVHVQYSFEFNTNHLKPVMYIGKDIHEGDRINIDLTKVLERVEPQGSIPIKIVLLNGEFVPVHKYYGEIPVHKYCLFGKRPARPDFEKYIIELEAQIEKLENEGEVI